MTSRYFSVPPKEFMFISRKFIGAYTFMTVIEAKTNVRAMVKKFMKSTLIKMTRCHFGQLINHFIYYQ